ncbi:MAG: OPT/YSL family transporter [Paludibaculum sp.]
MKAGGQGGAQDRTQVDLNFQAVFLGLAATFAAMIALYNFFAGSILAAVVAAVVMIILGFFFAAVSGNLVGIIGSSNNPISGLTLSTLIIAALMMVAIGVKGISGVAAVLGVAAVVCVSSAVAGEMLQDLKVGTYPGRYSALHADRRFHRYRRRSSLVLYFPLLAAAHGQHQGRWHRFRRRETLGARRPA